MNLQAILVRSPVNRLAAAVTSQRHVAQADTPMTREEVTAIFQRLQRKQRLLRHVLGITSKAQHANLMYQANKGRWLGRAKKEPRVFVEYRRVGNEMQRMQNALAEMRNERRAAYARKKAMEACA